MMLEPTAVRPLSVEDSLKDKIAQLGAITFHTFMQEALYGPGGYYQNQAPKLGAAGDFITAPEISSLFGQCLGKQLIEVCQDGKLSLMEIGPGHGTLAQDILTFLQSKQITVEAYYLVEISPSLTRIQQEKLKAFDCCQWFTDIKQVPRFKGAIIANELFDALPVHKVQLGEPNKHQEWYVTLDKEQTFQFQLGPLSCSQLAKQIEITLQSLESPLPAPYDTEFNLAQESCLEKCFDTLEQGIMLFIDYGFGEREYYHPSRYMGTLMAHHKHRASSRVLACPGKQDITAHVDFTALTRFATQKGSDLLGFCPQAHFLLNLEIHHLAQLDYHASQKIQTLVHPQEMGELFKVIAFGKEFEMELSGFKNRDFSYLL